MPGSGGRSSPFDRCRRTLATPRVFHVPRVPRVPRVSRRARARARSRRHRPEERADVHVGIDRPSAIGFKGSYVASDGTHRNSARAPARSRWIALAARRTDRPGARRASMDSVAEPTLLELSDASRDFCAGVYFLGHQTRGAERARGRTGGPRGGFSSRGGRGGQETLGEPRGQWGGLRVEGAKKEPAPSSRGVGQAGNGWLLGDQCTTSGFRVCAPLHPFLLVWRSWRPESGFAWALVSARFRSKRSLLIDRAVAVPPRQALWAGRQAQS